MNTKTVSLCAWRALGVALVAVAMVGCGGDDDGGSSRAGGSSPGGAGGPSTAQSNQVTINLGSMPNRVNVPTVSVTVCAPGSTINCQTVDNIQLDTMSSGLRIVNTAMSQVLDSLAITLDGSNNKVAECTSFSDGYTWGSIRSADVKIGDKIASRVPIAIIGDMLPSSVPRDCANTGRAENSVSALGANGILGIGVSPYDCGLICETSASVSRYFACPEGNNCTRSALALSSQVMNPIVRFPGDNNGIVLTMPAVSATGDTSATGTITFGIGTRPNNALSATQRYGTDATGSLDTTVFDSTSRRASAFFDTGSNAYFFTDSSLTKCSGGIWYCPASSTIRTVIVWSRSSAIASGTVAMTVANADTLFNPPGRTAFNDLAGDFGVAYLIDIGMPFFYGRTVYFGYDMTQVGGSQTPYVAF